MKTRRDLLDRDLASALTKDTRERAGAALREVVDEGIRVFERCSATAQGRDVNAGALFSFYHLVEMLDATEVLLDTSCVTPSWVTLRSAFESYLAVEYITKTNTPRRGAAWIVAEVHRRLSDLERLDPSTSQGKQFRAEIRKDVDAGNIPIPEVPDNQAERDGLEKVLRKPHLAEAAAEYDRLRRKAKKHPKFHALWDGLGDIEQLARHLGHSAQYEVLYRQWSATAHGEQLGRQLRDAGGGVPGITVLRSSSGMGTAYGLAIQFGLRGAEALLRCYRPAEVGSAARRNWYIANIRDAYFAVAPSRGPSSHAAADHQTDAASSGDSGIDATS